MQGSLERSLRRGARIQLGIKQTLCLSTQMLCTRVQRNFKLSQRRPVQGSLERSHRRGARIQLGIKQKLRMSTQMP